MKKQSVKYPCRNCIYFEVCGDNMRTQECTGRTTKSEKAKLLRKEGEKYENNKFWTYLQRTT